MTPSITRRTLVKGSAWAAPIVLASATVPAYAASPKKKDLCTAFSARPSGTFGSFSLTFDSDTERLSITGTDGTKLSPEVFTEPQWYIPKDQTVAYWVPATTPITGPTFTFDLSAVANSTGEISLVIYQQGCESLYYDGTRFTKTKSTVPAP